MNRFSRYMAWKVTPVGETESCSQTTNETTYLFPLILQSWKAVVVNVDNILRIFVALFAVCKVGDWPCSLLCCIFLIPCQTLLYYFSDFRGCANIIRPRRQTGRKSYHLSSLNHGLVLVETYHQCGSLSPPAAPVPQLIFRFSVWDWQSRSRLLPLQLDAEIFVVKLLKHYFVNDFYKILIILVFSQQSHSCNRHIAVRGPFPNVNISITSGKFWCFSKFTVIIIFDLWFLKQEFLSLFWCFLVTHFYVIILLGSFNCFTHIFNSIFLLA